ncbi:sporulation protein YtxC [Amphibacillus sediminis]|uniref:sporulation protein YtxC n=1 Tax=Amphibacillus sediminis TaxID=360185 RepID=UPI00082F1FE9|nr:sporulation protein YtxC [Amphibacillus sediminis]
MVKIRFGERLEQQAFRSKLTDRQLICQVVDHYELDVFEQHIDLINPCLLELFYVLELKPILLDKLRKDFYYDDFHEMEAILTIAAQMLLTDHYANVSFLNDLREEMTTCFYIKPNQKHYSFSEQKHLFYSRADWVIDEVLARAIDEKKQDEQYQIFVQSLRDFIQKRPVGSPCHVVIDGQSCTFFRLNGQKYRRDELDELIEETPLHIYQFAQNEYQLSPLLALNPLTIYLYYQDEVDPMIHTLQTIFDERMVLLPKSDFPFDS